MTLPFLKKADPTHFEYAENWSATAAYTRWLLPRCTVNPFLPAQCVHHLKYKRSLIRRILGLFLGHSFSVSVSGYEIPGWDCIPVSENNHHNSYGLSSRRNSVHYREVWVQHQGRPIENHQVWSKAWELRFRFWVLVAIWHWWKVLTPVVAGILAFSIAYLLVAVR